jgi:hypothetical protein
MVDEMERGLVISTHEAELLRTQIAREQSEERQRILQGEAAAAIDATSQATDALKAIGAEILRAGYQSFTSSLIAGWREAGTVNRRFTTEYTRLSAERRARTLVENGTAKDYAEAQRMVAGEARAAEAEKTAAAKEAQAERLANMAFQWALEAAVMAIPYTPQFNPVGAAVYGAAAAAAGVFAGSLHSQAASLTQGRGYTAAENDQLAQLRSGGGTAASAGAGSGDVGGTGGDRVVYQREVIMVVGDPFESPAETARRAARRLKLAKDLNLIQADV